MIERDAERWAKARKAQQQHFEESLKYRALVAKIGAEVVDMLTDGTLIAKPNSKDGLSGEEAKALIDDAVQARFLRDKIGPKAVDALMDGSAAVWCRWN